MDKEYMRTINLEITQMSVKTLETELNNTLKGLHNYRDNEVPIDNIDVKLSFHRGRRILARIIEENKRNPEYSIEKSSIKKYQTYLEQAYIKREPLTLY